MSYDDPRADSPSVMHERVEIDIGPEHLTQDRHDRRPGGGVRAADRCCGARTATKRRSTRCSRLADVMLLDSDEPDDAAAALDRASAGWRESPTSSTWRGCGRRRGASGWPRASTRPNGSRCWAHRTRWRFAIGPSRRRARCCWRVARLAPAAGSRAAGAENGASPIGTARTVSAARADRARARRPGGARAGRRDRVGPERSSRCRWIAGRGGLHAREHAPTATSEMAGARRLARRGRHPRRGRSPGAAARPDVRPRAGRSTKLAP